MKKLITMVVTLAMLMMMSTTAFAAAPAPEAEITGGDLSITDLVIDNFGIGIDEDFVEGVTLNGTAQTVTAVVTPTTLTDPRGSGDGWQVNLTASAFILDSADLLLAAEGAVGTLPLSSLELGTVSITVKETGSTAITNIDILQDKIDTAAGINILSAPLNGGMGTYTVSMEPMTLTLFPETTYAGTYTSTVTQTLTTGPVVE